MPSLDSTSTSCLKLTIIDEDQLDVETLLSIVDKIYRSKFKEPCLGLEDPKSTVIAERYNDLATKMYENKKYSEAQLYYTQSIASAPGDSVELRSTYARRADTLFHLQKYHECLLDINRAIRGTYSERMKEVLHERKQKYISEFAATITGQTDQIDTNAADPNDQKNIAPSIFLDGSREDLQNPHVSTKISIGPKDVKSLQDIPPGEMLWVEKFHVMKADYEKRFTHCDHCLKKCDALIPCPSCSQTMYCCEVCRTEAYHLYHRTECKVIKFYERGSTDWREPLALRSFLKSVRHGEDLPTLLSNFMPPEASKKNDDADNLIFVHSFVFAMNAMKIKGESSIPLFLKALVPGVEMIIVLRSFWLLQSKRFFSDGLTAVELFSVLFYSITLVSMGTNAFRITSPQAVPTSARELIGYGVFVKQSILKHSCRYANTHIVIDNGFRVLYATRPIKAGESLTFSERPIHTTLSSKERRRLFLDDFLIKCDECCKNPSADIALKNRKSRFKTGSSKQALLMTIYNAREKIYSLPAINFHLIITEFLESLHKSLETPSYETFWCERRLIEIMDLIFSHIHEQPGATFLRDYVEETFITIVNCINGPELHISQVID